jgi:hypothetical protein
LFASTGKSLILNDFRLKSAALAILQGAAVMWQVVGSLIAPYGRAEVT